MEPPYGIVNREFIQALASLDYAGVLVTPSQFLKVNTSYDGPASFGMERAEIFTNGLGMIPRIVMGNKAPTEMVLAALLDQPIVVAAHHYDVADGMSWLSSYAARLKTGGPIQLCDLSTLLEGSYETLADNDRLRIRTGARTIKVTIPFSLLRKSLPHTHETRRLPVHRREPSPPIHRPAAPLHHRMSKFILRRVFNRVFHAIARVVPGSTNVRPTLHRWRGVQIGNRVFIGDDVYIDNEYPECVEIQEGVQISLRTSIIAHTRGSGRLIIEKHAFVGPRCVLVCGPGKTLRIGAGAFVGVGCVIPRSIPPGLFVSLEAPKPIARARIPLPVATSMEESCAELTPLARPVTRPPETIDPSKPNT